MSLDMSDQAEFDHSALQEVANAIRENTSATDDMAGHNSQKRKRDHSGQDVSPDGAGRSSFKRVSSNQSKSTGSNGDASEAADNSFLVNHQDNDSAVEALQDYSALHQQAGSENQNGGHEHANASSTAAAALAGLYPSMTIPQPTDVSFAAQTSDGERGDSSFNLDHDASVQGGDSFNMDGGSGGGRGSSSKPAVGSEEWHKVRKDNHKEGENVPLPF